MHKHITHTYYIDIHSHAVSLIPSRSLFILIVGDNREGLLLSDRVTLLGDVTKGMAYLANQGFVHKNLQSEYVLVSKCRQSETTSFVGGKLQQ
eukprot:m.157169 g.157169  ORF g.157169 m.157169 type:complete len:93 (+) comp14332_c1_seq9:71-349(+)